METNACEFVRRAIVGRRLRSTGSGDVRVITTLTPLACRSSCVLNAMGSVASGSQNPVGPRAPAGGWPASTVIVRPRSGEAESTTGGFRTLSVNFPFSHSGWYPYTGPRVANLYFICGGVLATD